MNELEVGYEKMDAMPADRNLYASIFVCLGTYPDNHVLTPEEGQMLADYLNQGGNVYMEGADTWFYDPQNYDETPVHAMFNIEGLEDGIGNLSQVIGQAGSIADGMEFLFTGENSYIDQIAEIPPAQMMFMNSSPSFGAAVSYDAGTYRTVGLSFEFGGLSDGEKSKDDLMIRILEFFGITGIWTEVDDYVTGSGPEAGSYPNPFTESTVIRFTTMEESHVSLGIYDMNGRLVNELIDSRVTGGTHEVIWNGCNPSGKRVAEGMYFYKLNVGKKQISGKLMLMD